MERVAGLQVLRLVAADQPHLAGRDHRVGVERVRVFKIDFDDLPTAKRIVAECEQLEAFAAADPSRQAGAPQA